MAFLPQLSGLDSQVHRVNQHSNLFKRLASHPYRVWV
jgi:hypothetical protein